MQAPVALMMNQQQEHSKTRPEPGDRALPLCYGDLILLSAQFDAYLRDDLWRRNA